MAERNLSITEDTRGTNTWELVKQVNYPPAPPTTQKFSRRGNGTVRVVAGKTGGKFVPGQLKLRNFSAETTTYHAGEINLHAMAWMGHLQRVPVPRSATGILRGVGYATGLDGDLARVPGEARTTWDDQIALFTQNRCFAKFSSPDEDVGAFLGELPETCRMLVNWAGGYRRLMRKAREGGFTWSRANRAWQWLRDGKNLRSLPDKLSNAWLTWRYGVRPLFWDAQMLMKIAAERAKRSPAGLRRRHARFENQSQGTISGSTISIVDFGSYNTKILWTSKVKCETTVYYQILGEVSDLEWIIHKYGLHPSQVPALLWELTPLSFVVDWFIDVQSWIKSLQPPVDEKILGWSTSFRRDVELTTTCAGEPNYGNPAQWSQPPVGSLPTDKVSVRSLVRRTGTSNPGLRPVIRPKIALDVQKWADLASLALQRCKPKLRS